MLQPQELQSQLIKMQNLYNITTANVGFVEHIVTALDKLKTQDPRAAEICAQLKSLEDHNKTLISIQKILQELGNPPPSSKRERLKNVGKEALNIVRGNHARGDKPTSTELLRNINRQLGEIRQSIDNLMKEIDAILPSIYQEKLQSKQVKLGKAITAEAIRQQMQSETVYAQIIDVNARKKTPSLRQFKLELAAAQKNRNIADKTVMSVIQFTGSEEDTKTEIRNLYSTMSQMTAKYERLIQVASKSTTEITNGIYNTIPWHNLINPISDNEGQPQTESVGKEVLLTEKVRTSKLNEIESAKPGHNNELTALFPHKDRSIISKALDKQFEKFPTLSDLQLHEVYSSTSKSHHKDYERHPADYRASKLFKDDTSKFTDLIRRFNNIVETYCMKDNKQNAAAKAIEFLTTIPSHLRANISGLIDEGNATQLGRMVIEFPQVKEALIHGRVTTTPAIGNAFQQEFYSCLQSTLNNINIDDNGVRFQFGHEDLKQLRDLTDPIWKTYYDVKNSMKTNEQAQIELARVLTHYISEVETVDSSHMVVIKNICKLLPEEKRVEILANINEKTASTNQAGPR